MSLKRIVPYYIPLFPRMGTKYRAANIVDRFLYVDMDPRRGDHKSNAAKNHYLMCRSFNEKHVIPLEDEFHFAAGGVTRVVFWFIMSDTFPDLSQWALSTPYFSATFASPMVLLAMSAYLVNVPSWRSVRLYNSRLVALERRAMT